MFQLKANADNTSYEYRKLKLDKAQRKVIRDWIRKSVNIYVQRWYSHTFLMKQIVSGQIFANQSLQHVHTVVSLMEMAELIWKA